MPKIHILPQELVHRIAAGEVIERPASCVKELIENSIDACATKIECIVKENGLPFIRVIDNGEGMSQEDIKLAIESHTTSKLKTLNDLEQIRTLGFRGEALPSIKNVAQLEIVSRTQKEELGSYIKVINQKIVEEGKAPHHIGTTVTVRNLFYNLPARRKFIKSAHVEFRHIVNTFIPYTLAYPDKEFILIHDAERIFDLKPVRNLFDRIIKLFGEDFGFKLEEVSYENELKIYGFVSKPDAMDETPQEFIFINRRPCENNIVKRAIREAYKLPPVGRAPSFIIFIDLSPHAIDVNVHPRKHEVRLKEPEKVRKEIIHTIREQFGIKDFFFLHKKEITDSIPEELHITQIHNSYILLETKMGFWIIDQHAAHERILYEKILKYERGTKQLIFPVVMTLTPYEKRIYEEVKDALAQLGFDIQEFGKYEIRVLGIPALLEEFDHELFKSLLNELTEKGTIPDKFDELAKLIACKTAIKAGEKLTQEQMQNLIQELAKTDNPNACPHGRPTILRISLKELEKKFHRTG